MAKKFFHPITIKTCYLLNVGQYFLGRWLYLVWFGVTAIQMNRVENTVPWWIWIFFALIGFVLVFSLELGRNSPAGAPYAMRILWWGLMALDILGTILVGYRFPNLLDTFIVIWAQYCFTLDDLPPKPKKEAKSSRKAALLGG